MRHRKRGRKLGRNASHRRALGRNMVANFFQQFGEDKEFILTTRAKAKEYSSLAEKFITLAKRANACVEEAAKLSGMSADAVKAGWAGTARQNKENRRVAKLKKAAARKGETLNISPKNRLEGDAKTHADAYQRLSDEVRKKVDALLARSLYLRRLAASRMQSEDMTRKLFEEIAPAYAERKGGYTRVLKTGVRRLGDGTFKAMLAFTEHTGAAA